MAITCNFERDDSETKKSDKVIVRIAPGQVIGSDTPALKPVKNGAYLWVMDHRRRSARSWRAVAQVN
ncbi:MAG: hypothetical protein A2X32_00315 [Elusimicrobia bacterium GWC2_64_44]|nr:MAG: hypothetical protein A2X32_00315 [Elusimicrobia bacterium GWC2_64_44]